jgi:hypothetical protein
MNNSAQQSTRRTPSTAAWSHAARSSRVTSGRFLLAALATSVVNLLLHAAAYGLVLKAVYQAYPAGSEEFVRQLHRPGDQLVVWAMALTSVTMGVFITTVMRWSGARTLAAGLVRGAILGLLFWLSVNSGLYASSHIFSLPSAAVDTVFSSLCMTVSAACAVLLLNRPGPRTPEGPQLSRA